MTRKRGDCAEVAGLLVIGLDAEYPDYLVCHGRPVGRGPENGGDRYFHAWIESPDGTVVIDRSNGLDVTMEAEIYYMLGRIVPENVRRYTADEVRDYIGTTRQWGPWEEPV